MDTGEQTPAAGAGRGARAGGERTRVVSELRPNRYRTAWAGELRAGRAWASACGWPAGSTAAATTAGSSSSTCATAAGLLQLVFRPEEAPEAHAAAEALRAEDVISAEGELVAREEGAVNPDAAHRRGGAGRVGSVDLLADAETPPFQIDEDEPVERGAAPALPLPRPAQARRMRAQPRAAPRRGAHDPRAPERARLPRGRDADPHPLDARGRARLPGAEPAQRRARGTRCRSRRSSSSSC